MERHSPGHAAITQKRGAVPARNRDGAKRDWKRGAVTDKPQRKIPTGAEMVAYGRSYGLHDDAIQAAFQAVTGRTTTDGWESSVTECRDWARTMERMSEALNA